MITIHLWINSFTRCATAANVQCNVNTNDVRPHATRFNCERSFSARLASYTIGISIPIFQIAVVYKKRLQTIFFLHILQAQYLTMRVLLYKVSASTKGEGLSVPVLTMLNLESNAEFDVLKNHSFFLLISFIPNIHFSIYLQFHQHRWQLNCLGQIRSQRPLLLMIITIQGQ